MKNISMVAMIVMGLIFLNGCGGGGTSNEGDEGSGNDTAAQKVFIDTDTKLMWQDDAYVIMVTKPMLTEENFQACNDDNTSGACADYTGDTAVTYCSEITLEGYADWRIPTSDELNFLYQFKHNLLKNVYIPNWEREWAADWKHAYWTPKESDKDKNCTSAVAIVESWGKIYAGSSVLRFPDCIEKSRKYYIRCVRDAK